jgi:hypothetical protein
VKWAVESLEAGAWTTDSETGLLLVPFWRSARTVYLQNNLVPPPNPAGSAAAARRSAPEGTADPLSR